MCIRDRYGSARWGTPKDIEPFMAPKFADNIILTKTEQRKLLEILFQSASLVIDTIRTFFLIVLSILGPIMCYFRNSLFMYKILYYYFDNLSILTTTTML